MENDDVIAVSSLNYDEGNSSSLKNSGMINQKKQFIQMQTFKDKEDQNKFQQKSTSSYPSFQDKLNASEVCPQIKMPASQSIEVTQVKLDNPIYSFPFIVGQADIYGNNNNQGIIQGVPIIDSQQSNQQTNGMSLKNCSYQDHLRFEKYEFEKSLKPLILQYSKYSKLSILLVFCLVTSIVVQYFVSQHNKAIVHSNHKFASEKEQQDEEQKYDLNDCIYYFAVDYLLWFTSLFSSHRALRFFSPKQMNVSICFASFSIIPSILGFSVLCQKCRDQQEIIQLVANIFMVIIETISKLLHGMLRGKVMKDLFTKHASQFQGLQEHLMNPQSQNQG